MAIKNKHISQFFDNAYYPIYWFDKDGRIVYANNSTGRELGYTPDELLSLTVFDLDRNLKKSEWERNFNRIMTGQLTHVKDIHWRKDGSTVPVRISFSISCIKNKLLVCAILRNITKELKAQQQQRYLQFAVENAVDSFFLTKDNGKIIYANKSACHSLGYSFDELTSMTVYDIDPAADVVTIGRFKLKDRVITGDHGNFETHHLRKDGTSFPVEVTFQNLAYEGENYSFAFARDITERKHSMRQLEILRFTIDNAVDSIYMMDKDARVFYANKRACETLGYSYEEMLGLAVYDIDPSCTPEIYRAIWDEAHAGNLESIERVHIRKDGTRFPVEISVNNSVYDDFAYSCTFSRDISARKAVERQLQFTQFAIDNAGDAVFVTDSRSRIIYANETACRSLGYTKEELTSMTIRDIAPHLAEGEWENDERWHNLVEDGHYTRISRHHRKDGSSYPVEVNANMLRFDNELYSCSVVRNITERLETEKALRDSEEKFRLISDTSPVALIIHKVSDGKILYANSMAETLFSKTRNEIGKHTIFSLFENSEARNKFENLLSPGTQIYGKELLLSNLSDRPVWISINAKTISLQGEQVVCCAFQDITEAHELSSQLSYHATYDALTGLVNRREFEPRLQRVIKTAARDQTENAMCFLDLDQFKIINDTCGHVAGDELLRQLAQVLHDNIRKRDTLARLGGDEFAVLLESCTLDQARRVADSIRESIQKFRFIWENNSFTIGVSIGLVPINCQDESITEVLKRADTACYEAKEKGRNRVHVYHPDDEEITYRHGEMQWVTRITSALEHNRLQIWSQTIIPIKETRRGEHYELLIRMVDNNGESIPPSSFLPAAERYNLISRLDRWIVATTLKWFRDNPKKYDKLWMCSINLSGQTLGDEDFQDEIMRYFNNLNISPGKFCFEVTETAAIANLNNATRFIKSLTKLGCRFALDDFGSGLSSYAYLKNLPVDYIKIDGMFVEDLVTNPMHTALVKSINDVGHVMGKKTIAEYVESEEILAALEDIGVDYAQGYGIEKPVLLIDGTRAELKTLAN